MLLIFMGRRYGCFLFDFCTSQPFFGILFFMILWATYSDNNQRSSRACFLNSINFYGRSTKSIGLHCCRRHISRMYFFQKKKKIVNMRRKVESIMVVKLHCRIVLLELSCKLVVAYIKRKKKKNERHAQNRFPSNRARFSSCFRLNTLKRLLCSRSGKLVVLQGTKKIQHKVMASKNTNENEQKH